jgi:hypothetical protein
MRGPGTGRSLLLQSPRESVIYGESGRLSGRALMGEVIQGPWRRPSNVDLTRVLGDEIARMTRALEELRELHQRNEQANGAERPAVGEGRKE